MDSTEHLEPSCNTLSMTASETQWNLQMSTSTLKQETAECIDEEASPCNDDKCPYLPLELSDYVNYYDSEICVLDEMKKEFPEDECPQSDCSMKSKVVVTEDKEPLKFIDKQRLEDKNVEEALSLIKNEDIIKMEKLEVQDKFDNAEATSIHDDVLVTPQELQCKLYGGKFKNSCKLLKHNNGHLKVELNTSRDNEINKLYQCQYCNKGFNNHDNLLAHVGDVHSEIIPKFGKLLKNMYNLNRHVLLLDKSTYSPKHLTQNNSKCKICHLDVENRNTLCIQHMKLCQSEYKQVHKNDNVTDTNEAKVQCESCQKVFNTKSKLKNHIKSVHYDYGKVFECWCGKQFRTPPLLSSHKRVHKDGNVKDTNEANFQCNSCHKIFNSHINLTKHKRYMHYDYGKVFECKCGKQFRTPRNLSEHKRVQQCGKVKDTNAVKFQCESCPKAFYTKKNLKSHIKYMHYDYGKVFECWCGQQFRTPNLLSSHKRVHKDGNVKDTNEANFQ